MLHEAAILRISKGFTEWLQSISEGTGSRGVIGRYVDMIVLQQKCLLSRRRPRVGEKPPRKLPRRYLVGLNIES
jgi:hypothetical protein